MGKPKATPWSLLAVVVFALVAKVDGSPLAREFHSRDASNYVGGRRFPWPISSGNGEVVPFNLCECEPASADNGLSCGKEGWFISSFEHEGEFEPFGMHLLDQPHIPLSKAICCRPCLPKERLNVTGLHPEEAEVRAVVSIACHEAYDTQNSPQFCENGAGSLVMGWYASELATKEGLTPAYYPEGPVQCCTPALLLASGDVWELERCQCVPSMNRTSCGELHTHHLLQGFRSSVPGPKGPSVPQDPAVCCRLCLSERVHPIDDCAYLDDCNGNGRCKDSMCECGNGFSGPTCADRGTDVQRWLLSFIVFTACTGAVAIVSVLGRVVRYYRNRPSESDSESGEQLQETLILRVDDDNGSVGSENTTDCDSDTELPEGPDGHPPADAGPQEGEQRVGEGAQRDPGERWPEGLPGDWPPGVALEVDGARRGSLRPVRSAGTPAGPLAGEIESQTAGQREDEAGVVESQAAHGHVGATEMSDEEDNLKGGKSRKTPREPKPEDEGMRGVDCSVCMCRPVQVVVIPCGHACMCRRCSRKVSRCPVCRKEILRRQRLFIGG